MALFTTIGCGAIAWLTFWGGSNAATGGIVTIAVMVYTVGCVWYLFFRLVYRRLRGLPIQFSIDGN